MLQLRSLLFMQFVLYTTLLEAGQNFCKLTGLGGDQEGVPCVLPFRFKSILYNTCTNASDPHGKFWCSTRTFLNGSHMEHSGQWGYCKICQNIQEDTNETKVSVQTPVTVRPSPSAEGNITGAYTRVSTIRLGDWLPDPDTVECYNNGIEESFFTMDGTKVDPGQIPFLVLIGYKSLSGQIHYRCGGALINNYYVITAASCLSVSNPKQVIGEIVLGERILPQDDDCSAGCLPVARFYPSLSDITVHENFSNERLWDQGNDIALVRLPRPVEFRAGIKPVCLPWKNSLVQGETFLAGWAKTTIDSTDLKDLRSLSGYLKYAKIQRISISQCIGTSGFEQVHPLRHICAVGELSEGADNCSSVMLLVSGTKNEPFNLEGLFSYGTKSCLIGYPLVYTNIKYYLPWILRNMRP